MLKAGHIWANVHPVPKRIHVRCSQPIICRLMCSSVSPQLLQQSFLMWEPHLPVNTAQLCLCDEETGLGLGNTLCRCLDDPSTDKPTTRQFNPSVHPMNCLLWQFAPVTFLHLYNPSRYFSFTPASRWRVCHMWHDVHPPQNALRHNVHLFLKWNVDVLPLDFLTRLWWDGYSQSDRTEVYQPMDQCAMCPNLT
jgi:hypothetical protein